MSKKSSFSAEPDKSLQAPKEIAFCLFHIQVAIEKDSDLRDWNASIELYVHRVKSTH